MWNQNWMNDPEKMFLWRLYDSGKTQGYSVFTSCLLRVCLGFPWYMQHEGNTKQTPSSILTKILQRRVLWESYIPHLSFIIWFKPFLYWINPDIESGWRFISTSLNDRISVYWPKICSMNCPFSCMKCSF